MIPETPARRLPTPQEDCPDCDGKGIGRAMVFDGSEYGHEEEIACGRCDGTGKIDVRAVAPPPSPLHQAIEQALETYHCGSPLPHFGQLARKEVLPPSPPPSRPWSSSGPRLKRWWKYSKRN